jgi:DNA-directed RNA polymerase specialized sigma24 family protein
VSTTPTGGRAVSDPRAIAEVAPELHRRLRRRMGLMLYRHRIPPQGGEDLVQSSWLLAVARWPDIRDPESWLLGTLERRCIVYWRQRQLQAQRYQPLDGLAPEPAIAPVQAQRDRLVDLGMAVRRLPLAQRRLLACRYRLGMSPPETAAALGLAPSTVRPIIHLARGRLWERLGEERPRRTRPWHRARSQQPPAEPEPAAPSAAWPETVEAYLAASRLTPATMSAITRISPLSDHLPVPPVLVPVVVAGSVEPVGGALHTQVISGAHALERRICTLTPPPCA